MSIRRMAWGVLTACALAMPAAAAPQSPACAMLSDNEAILAVNGAPTVNDGGAAQAGYSDCAWSNAGGSAVMSLLVWSPDFFAGGKETSQVRFDKLVAALRLRHLPAAAVSRLGKQALLIDESSGGLAAYTLVVLIDRGAVVEIAGRGVPRAATLAAGEAVVGRMSGAVAASGPATSPACALIADADLPGASFAVHDGGPAANGESVCNWQDEKNNYDVSLTLRAHKPSADPANTDADYYTALPDPEPGADPEPLEGVGEKATMEASGDDPNASYTITLLRRGQLAVLSTFRVERAGAVKLAAAVAGRIASP